MRRRTVEKSKGLSRDDVDPLQTYGYIVNARLKRLEVTLRLDCRIIWTYVVHMTYKAPDRESKVSSLVCPEALKNAFTGVKQDRSSWTAMKPVRDDYRFIFPLMQADVRRIICGVH